MGTIGKRTSAQLAQLFVLTELPNLADNMYTSTYYGGYSDSKASIEWKLT